MEISDIVDWWNDNKKWFFLPFVVNIVVLLIALILMIATGKDINVILKLLFFILVFSCPIMGYYMGDYLDPVLAPLFDKIRNATEAKK